MSRTSIHDGVRRVVVDNFGGGSITVAPGPQPDAVECAIDAADDGFLELVHIRQERDALRISVPPALFRAADAHLRLGAPPGLEYVIKVGSAEVSLEPENWAQIAADTSTPQQEVETRELFAALHQAIEGNLSPHQREVLVAVTLNDVPIDVLAERLHTTRGALYKTIHDARRKLRAALAARGLGA